MIDHLTLLALAAGSFLALCAGLPRYQAKLCGGKLAPATARNARIAGWMLLAGLAIAALALFGLGRGLVMLAGYSTVGAALAVALANRSRRPR